MNQYSHDFFYGYMHEDTIYSANAILSILLAQIPTIHSAVDVGCGVGTWLSVLYEKGVKDIQGYDGSWVDPNQLVIPQSCFSQIDLGKVAKLPRKYGLAISLEVAEHLPTSHSEAFIRMLTELSDNVLFSAAIPYQGGTNHINEQWQDYWVQLFESMNYNVYDFIRPKIWNDNHILFWYKQNILFFSKRTNSPGVSLESLNVDAHLMPFNIVHPDLYLKRLFPQEGLRGTIKLSYNALKQSIRFHFIRSVK